MLLLVKILIDKALNHSNKMDTWRLARKALVND